VSVDGCSPCKRSARILCGAVAGPLFVTAFTAIGAARRGYDWRRHPVSSLAIGPRGWQQRANFIVAGILYAFAAVGLRRSDRRRAGQMHDLCAIPVFAGIPIAVPCVTAGRG
jgi:hypothetical protein